MEHDSPVPAIRTGDRFVCLRFRLPSFEHVITSWLTSDWLLVTSSSHRNRPSVSNRQRLDHVPIEFQLHPGFDVDPIQPSIAAFL